MSVNYDAVGFSQEQLSLLQEKDQAISDLQFSLDEKSADLEEVPSLPWLPTELAMPPFCCRLYKFGKN